MGRCLLKYLILHMADKKSLCFLAAGVLVGLVLSYMLPLSLHYVTESVGSTNVRDFQLQVNGPEQRSPVPVSKKIEDTCKVRIFCLVMTYDKNHRTKADQVMASWGKRCDKLMFMSNADDAKLPVIKVDVGGGRDTLTDRHTAGFDYAYKHHLTDFDWFFKADDDTYAIIENLRYLGATNNKDEPVYFGHAFNTHVKQGYSSGGSGYVLSRAALERYGKRAPNQCQDSGGSGIDDMLFGQCLEKVGVKLLDSRDEYGKSRFHCFDPKEFIVGFSPKSKWLIGWDKYGAKQGAQWISNHAISFHYVNPDRMKELEFFIYHLYPYGTSFDPTLNCTAVRAQIKLNRTTPSEST